MPTYTIQEWLEDYGYAVELGRDPGLSPTALTQQLLNHFCSKYQDDPISRCHRVMQAARFVEAHMDDLSFGQAAVAGDKQCLLAEPLLRALHEYFTGLSASEMNRMPSVTEMIRIAKKHGA